MYCINNETCSDNNKHLFKYIYLYLVKTLHTYIFVLQRIALEKTIFF